jgi:hypothetical protein
VEAPPPGRFRASAVERGGLRLVLHYAIPQHLVVGGEKGISPFPRMLVADGSGCQEAMGSAVGYHWIEVRRGAGYSYLRGPVPRGSTFGSSDGKAPRGCGGPIPEAPPLPSVTRSWNLHVGRSSPLTTHRQIEDSRQDQLGAARLREQVITPASHPCPLHGRRRCLTSRSSDTPLARPRSLRACMAE